MKILKNFVVEYYTHSYHSQNRNLVNLKADNIDDALKEIKDIVENVDLARGSISLYKTEQYYTNPVSYKNEDPNGLVATIRLRWKGNYGVGHWVGVEELDNKSSWNFVTIDESVSNDEEEFTTTFMNDFAIADRFGIKAIKDTFNRSFRDWKSDYRYLTDLVIVLNQRCWMWYEKGNEEFSKLYADLYYKANDYARSHLKGKEFDYYFNLTD